jgi:hypothetical protein
MSHTVAPESAPKAYSRATRLSLLRQEGTFLRKEPYSAGNLPHTITNHHLTCSRMPTHQPPQTLSPSPNNLFLSLCRFSLFVRFLVAHPYTLLVRALLLNSALEARSSSLLKLYLCFRCRLIASLFLQFRSISSVYINISLLLILPPRQPKLDSSSDPL